MGSPSSSSGSRSAGCPARSTGRITFVRSVTASATRAGSILRSSPGTSTKPGAARACRMTFAVAGHVIGLVITSSPGPTPSATTARWRAAVPDARASTCSASRYSAIRRSSSAARGPVVSQPERRVSATAATSSSPIAGGWKPSIVARRVSDESFDIGLESNHRLRAGRPLERLLAAVADGEDGTRTVGAAAELAEAVSGATVDADAADALEGKCLLHADDLAQLPRRRDEEADAGAPDPSTRGQRGGSDLLSECRRQSGAVEVDAEGRAAELCIVTPAEPCRQLADADAVR